MSEVRKEIINKLTKLVDQRKNLAGEIKYDNCIVSTTDLDFLLNVINEENKTSEANKKKIKELEEKNAYLKYLYDDCCKCLINTIEKQKVKDKIKKLEEKMKYEDNEKILVYLHKQRKILQELLEDK